MWFTQAQLNTRTKPQNGRRNRTRCTGGPQLSSAISLDFIMNPLQGPIIFVSDVLPLFPVPSKKAELSHAMGSCNPCQSSVHSFAGNQGPTAAGKMAETSPLCFQSQSVLESRRGNKEHLLLHLFPCPMLLRLGYSQLLPLPISNVIV